MDVADARRLRGLTAKNGKLKTLPAEAMFDIEALTIVVPGKRQARTRGERGCGVWRNRILLRAARRRFGCRRIHALIRREELVVN
jgi:hypothetical protein